MEKTKNPMGKRLGDKAQTQIDSNNLGVNPLLNGILCCRFSGKRKTKAINLTLQPLKWMRKGTQSLQGPRGKTTKAAFTLVRIQIQVPE
jgi:hypothetical protein